MDIKLKYLSKPRPIKPGDMVIFGYLMWIDYNTEINKHKQNYGYKV